MRRPPQREAFSFQHCPNSPIQTLNKLKRAGGTAVRPPPSRSHAQFALPHLSLCSLCRTHCSAAFSFQHCLNSPIKTLNKLKRAGRTAVRPPPSSSHAQFALPHLTLCSLCRTHCSASPSSSSHAQFALPHLSLCSLCRTHCSASLKKIIAKRNLWFAPPVIRAYFIGNDRITTNDIEEYSLIKSS